MSRVGRQVISIPDGVQVSLSDHEIGVKGPKGELKGPLPKGIKGSLEEGVLSFSREAETKEVRSLHGLTRALANNMVIGVTEGFAKGLEIEGVGYRAEVKGKNLVLTLGFSHLVEMPIPEGLSVKVENTTSVRVEGINKEVVGQYAADIRRLRPPEPYKGKGIRYTGEHIRRKVGKTGA